MWSIYAFKLAYAEDNSFELRVNTDWSCFEFVEKVTAVARATFPSISITDVVHLTESWNQIRDPNYNNMSSEENIPIPLISQTIAQRYPSRYLQNLQFYVYFRHECQTIRLRHARNESRTLEQVGLNIDYYYDIWITEIDNERDIQRFRNITTQPPLLPTGTYGRDSSDRSDAILYGWTGMNSQYIGGLDMNSQAVSLDDMLTRQPDDYPNENMSNLLPRNLFDDVVNEAGLEPVTYISNDSFPSLDRNNIYNYTNQRTPFWSIPENIHINPLIFNENPTYIENDDIYRDNELETSFTPRVMDTHDCCICFTESTQCFTLEHCNHAVCDFCYTGVYTRVNGEVDLRCPLCRIPNSFNNNIYRQITGTHL
jgi:hypothetical protein